MARDDLLFYQNDLDGTLRAHLAAVHSKVDSIPQAQFMNARPEDMEHLSSDMAVDPLKVYENRAEMEQAESKIDVSAGGRQKSIRGRWANLSIRSQIR